MQFPQILQCVCVDTTLNRTFVTFVSFETNSRQVSHYFFLLFVAGYVNEFGASLVADWVQLVDVHRLIEWLPPPHLTFDLP